MCPAFSLLKYLLKLEVVVFYRSCFFEHDAFVGVLYEYLVERTLRFKCNLFQISLYVNHSNLVSIGVVKSVENVSAVVVILNVVVCVNLNGIELELARLVENCKELLLTDDGVVYGEGKGGVSIFEFSAIFERVSVFAEINNELAGDQILITVPRTGRETVIPRIRGMIERNA